MIVPGWPPAAKQCVSGRVRISEGGQFIPTAAGKTAVNILSVVPVDFDGDGKNEYAAAMMCGEGPEAGGRMVVGYRRGGSTLEPIGRIVGTQDGFAMMDHMRRKGNAIEILVSRQYSDGGQQGVPSEWRTYELRGGRFHQVGAAIRPGSVRLSVETRQSVLRPVDGAGDGVRDGVRAGAIQFTVRNAGTATAPLVTVQLQLPAYVQPAGSGWDGCAGGADSVICHLTDLGAGRTADMTLEVLATGDFSSSEPALVAAYSGSIEVYEEAVSEPAPLAFLLP